MHEKKSYTLINLGCPNCAAKMESRIQKLPGVESASLDFGSRRLAVAVDGSVGEELILGQMQQIIRSVEPDCSIVENAGENLREKTRTAERRAFVSGILKVGAAGLLFAAAFVLEAAHADGRAVFALFALSYLVAGGEVLLRAFKNLIRGGLFDENFLMSVATLGAFAIRQYEEGAAVMIFYGVGEIFEDMAVSRSRRSIEELMDIRPDYANLLSGSETLRVSPAQVQPGDLIVVKPGEKVPLDGVVVSGSSLLDTSALTGESVLREAGEGGSVLSGFVNKNGRLTVRVEKPFAQSTASRILELVQNAAQKKAKTEAFITRFARYYTPAVTGLALALAVLPPLVLGGGFSAWVYRALSFLVVSCPCALVISVPLGFFSGLGEASRQGVLVKGGNALEALAKLDAVVFDKTGTLTKGVFEVAGLYPAGADVSREQLLALAASAESGSNHPIAQSILDAARQAGCSLQSPQSFEELAGMGTKAVFDAGTVLVGNQKLMEAQGVAPSRPDGAGTVAYVALGKRLLGSILISDVVKEDAAAGMAALRAAGVRGAYMLTGDSIEAARPVAEQLGLDGFYAGLLPDDKVSRLEAIMAQKQTGGVTAFVGDGINDAPVLARADLGIAMGGLGSDAAVEAADVVIMRDEPSKIAQGVRLARFTHRVVRQNIVLALSIKFLVLILVAFGLANMWQAVFADVGVTLLAVLHTRWRFMIRIFDKGVDKNPHQNP